MVFTLFGGGLGLLHLHDCGVAEGLSLERIMCLSFVGELTLGCDGGGRGAGGVRSNRFVGCTYNQLQDI